MDVVRDMKWDTGKGGGEEDRGRERERDFEGQRGRGGTVRCFPNSSLEFIV